jgi:hypothetical protein
MLPTQFASLFLSLLCPQASSVEEPPSSGGVEPAATTGHHDPLSIELLSHWEDQEYRPSRQGLNSGSFDLTVERSGTRGSQSGKARYAWTMTDEKSASSLQWEPASLGRELEREGWSKTEFDDDFLDNSNLDQLAGCQLQAKRLEDGSAIITIEGDNARALSELHFDADGLLSRSVHRVPGGAAGGNLEFTLTPTWRREDHHVIKVAEEFRMKAVWGSVVAISTFEYTEVEGVLLPHRQLESSTWNGMPSGQSVYQYTSWNLGKTSPEQTSKSKSAAF